MCTVSFVNNNGVVIITSNRDEQVLRPNAIAPRNYSQNGKNVIYPKDPKAGGTWFAVDADKTVLVLLNGGFLKHEVAFSYRKSRGLIALDIIYSDSPKDFWNQIVLENIEPFTLALYQDEKLYELVWDGFQKRKSTLDETQNHIWSSVTLYSGEIRQKRSDWFELFLKDKNQVLAQNMFDFHRNTEGNDAENGLIINRENALKTLSITQITIEQNKGIMRHYDLINTQDFSTAFISI